MNEEVAVDKVKKTRGNFCYDPNYRGYKKRYRGKTHYMSQKCSRTDREGKKLAWAEWLRVRAWVDGIGECPYGPSIGNKKGALIPVPLIIDAKIEKQKLEIIKLQNQIEIIRLQNEIAESTPK